MPKGNQVKSGSTVATANEAALPRIILPLLCICGFATVFNVGVISPILVEISQDFGVSIAYAGGLTIAYALPAAFMALVFGPLSDRYGRRFSMLLGLYALTLASFGSVFAPTFVVLLICRVFCGLGAAALMPSVFASVGDYFPYAERGKAMAWVVNAATVAIVLGVPIGTLIAASFSWRWMFALVAVALLAATLAVAILFPHEVKSAKRETAGFADYKARYLWAIKQRNVIAALIASLLFGSFWQGWSTYVGAYFTERFSLSVGALAPIYAVQGIAILIGSIGGGRLSDRFGKKPVIVFALATSAMVMALQTNLASALWLAIVLNSIMAVPGGIRFTAGNALLTELVPSSRATMMSMNSAALQIGAMLGTAVGGFLIATTGKYTALGSAFGALSLLAAIIFQLFVSEAARNDVTAKT
jgi:predicted MFS family arabinose efflux permease